MIDAALPEMRAQFAVLDNAVAATGFLAGERFTLADIALLPTLYYLNKMPESRAMLSATQYLGRYFDRHSQRPSFRQTLPETTPDAVERAIAAAQAA
jgi:glutathione S-transferase